MNFFTEYWTRYFDFKGRTSRQNYWLMVLVYCAITFVLGKIGIAILSTLWSLAIFIPNLAMQVRRLHDVNKSGKWILVEYILTFVGTILLTISIISSIASITTSSENTIASLIESFKPSALSIIVLLTIFTFRVIIFVFTLLPSVNENNKYGEPYNS